MSWARFVFERVRPFFRANAIRITLKILPVVCVYFVVLILSMSHSVTQCYPTSLYVASHRPISPLVFSCRLMLRHVPSCHPTLPHAASSCFKMLKNASCRLMLPHVVSCYHMTSHDTAPRSVTYTDLCLTIPACIHCNHMFTQSTAETRLTATV